MQENGDQSSLDDTVIIRNNRKEQTLRGWLILHDHKGLAQKSYELNRSTISIGRDNCNDIVLQDQTVSRIHCYIKIIADELMIIEEDPINGIFINEYPQSRSKLEDGMTVRLGRTIFRVKLL
ncbi:MAG: FHA domain-containing protein [Deltaproteobacteria bacterium]|nr:FHA domain-containing protein [Deltaproteobacteria bacterium]